MPSPTRKSKEINPMLLRTLNPALFQSPQTPRKSIRKTRVRKSVIFRIVNSVNRTEDTPSKENHYHKKNILNAMNNRLNDKKEPVPNKCPKCGSKISIFFKGEPVYACTNNKCGKTFGVVPFSESIDIDYETLIDMDPLNEVIAIEKGTGEIKKYSCRKYKKNTTVCFI